MIAATKDKTKLDVDKNSAENETVNTDKPLTRQEDAQEADINYLLAKYGHHALMNRPQPVWGEFDYTVTLQQHYEAAAKIRGSYELLPQHVKDRYSSEEFFGRLAAGEDIDLTEEKPEVPSDNVTNVTN